MVEQLVQAKLSITRACQIAGLSRAAYYKRPRPASERDAPVIDALNAIISRHGRWGFWKCFSRLRLDGRLWNKKRVYRVYCEMGLNLPRRWSVSGFLCTRRFKPSLSSCGGKPLAEQDSKLIHSGLPIVGAAHGFGKHIA